MEIEPIGIIRSPFKEKFGIPRQSGLTSVPVQLVFPENSATTARLKGLSGFTHLWVIFEFHKVQQCKNTVRPPRAGGKINMGVWATRSPHRPNRMGLSLCRILEVFDHQVVVEGLDALDATPILDIKPFVFEDIPKSKMQFGWTERLLDKPVRVEIPEGWNSLLSGHTLKGLTEILKADPRPASRRNKPRDFAVIFGEVDFQIRALENKKEILMNVISFQKI